jgi:hypothetical protein
VPNAAAETHVRLLAEAELRRAITAPSYSWLDEDFRLGGEPAKEAGLHRVRAVASALLRVGALDGVAAHSLLSDFAAALAARGLAPAHSLLDAATPSTSEPGPGEFADWPVLGGRYRAIPISRAVPAEWGGYLGEVHLQTLVLAPDCAMIVTTFVSTWREPASLPADGRSGQPSFPPFGESGLTDDRGRPYRLDYQTAEGGWHQYGILGISPIPPADVRWLDMPTGASGVLRIPVAGRGAVPDRSTGAGRNMGTEVSAEPLPARAAGEHLLTAVADTLLGGGSMVGMAATSIAAGLAEVETALRAVQALPDGSEIAAHLAALCQRRSIDVRGDLAHRAQAAGLPSPWASVLSRSQHRDGRTGVVPLAAVLPELDGARLVLAGLSSWERQLSVPFAAWGWSPRPRVFRPRQPFSWWARDDAGHWYIGRAGPFHSMARTFQVEFTPPLHPDARSLDIILTGSAARVTVSVPLRWPGEPG